MSCCTTYITPDFQQAAAESIIHIVDWPTLGLPDGVTIISQTFLPAGATDYTINNEEIITSDTQTQFQLTGGIPGTTYSIVNQIVTSDGETFQTTLIFGCVLLNMSRGSGAC